MNLPLYFGLDCRTAEERALGLLPKSVHLQLAQSLGDSSHEVGESEGRESDWDLLLIGDAAKVRSTYISFPKCSQSNRLTIHHNRN